MNHKPMLVLGAAGMLPAACATPTAPVSFELVDTQAAVFKGSIDAQKQNMTITIGSREYAGFYVIATDTVNTSSLGGFSRRLWPTETRSSVSSNIARAHLKAADGERLACEFMFEGDRGVGSCRTQAGNTYQFVAGS